ncbi:TolB-like translocation protein [Microbacterium pygmaeum]|uniref:SbsA Ig-like domain-containing protein n=1 Tax=Microbacterium pygmaeum TaxID=370764 RepID=A0A1G7UZE3_9MICO|nr:hypothetical protein [Microbacterium pygmaeum]SDG52876.1 hypothetical protein SAMN04489810_0544 [Microbacterium pygmaeum]
MSTEPGGSATRAGRTRRRRSRAFLVTFTVVVAALAALGLAGAAAGVASGPRISSVDVDPAAAVAASGSRLILTTSASLEEVDAAQISVSPATPFNVDTSGRSVGLRFGLPLHDDTEYTVEFSDVQSLGGGPTANLAYTFRTPPIEVFLLQRTSSGDTVFRTDLTGEEAVPVFSADHIEDYRATSSHLVMSVRDGDATQLVVTDLDGGSERQLALPGDGYVSALQSADRGELIGYTFSDADLSAAGGTESALFTASLKETEADAAPTQVVVPGAEPRVAEWRFVPDTESILLLTFDGSLLLTGSSGESATALGSAISIDGTARGSAAVDGADAAPQAIVTRPDGLDVIDLADASETPLVQPDRNLGLAGPVLPVPGGGTVRTSAPLGANGLPAGATISSVAHDGATRVLMEVPAADAVLQTCVSPSGRYAAVLIAPDAVQNPYDTYRMPIPGKVETHIVEIADGAEVVKLNGFDISWCRVPPR